MARIRKPKNIILLRQELREKLGIELSTRLNSLMSRYGVTDGKGRYLHWDQLLWRIEKGVDADQAWLSTKSSRASILKFAGGLKAQEDTGYFNYCIPDSLAAKLHYIDKKTGGGHSIGESPFMSAGEKGRYLVQSLMMEEAITSSQLEGASTTRKVAKEMLETG